MNAQLPLEGQILNPEQAKEAHQLLQRKTGEQFGHSDTRDVPQRKESIECQPPYLDDGSYAWYITGVAYSLAGINKSIFDLASWELRKPIYATTHQSDTALFSFDGVDVSKNRWAYIIQGIDLNLEPEFNYFVQTSLFTKGKVSWALTPVKLRIKDPFSKQPRGAWVYVILPETDTKQVIIKSEPGLLLSELVLAMTSKHDQSNIRASAR